MRKMAGTIKALLGVGVLAIGLASVPAYALSVSPSTLPHVSVPGGANCDATCMSGLTGIPNLIEVYKQNQGGSEVGSAAPYYTTTFNYVAGQGGGFTITWDGPKTIVCPDCVLYVKDGNLSGYAFVAQMSNWDGKETITGSGFFPTKGSVTDGSAISHVSIFSTNRDPRTPPVPEPSSMLLLGSGLVGMVVWKRRKAS